MRLVSEVLRLKQAAKLSHRQIARALQIGSGTVTNYLAAAERAGLSWPLPVELDEAALAAKLWPPAPAGEAKFVTPDFVYIHAKLKQKGSRGSCCGMNIVSSIPARPISTPSSARSMASGASG